MKKLKSVKGQVEGRVRMQVIGQVDRQVRWQVERQVERQVYDGRVVDVEQVRRQGVRQFSKQPKFSARQYEEVIGKII